MDLNEYSPGLIIFDIIKLKGGEMETKLANHWWAILIRGIVAIVFAFLAFFATGFTLELLLIFLAIYLLLNGLFAIIGSLMATSHKHWWMLLFEGLISAAAGIAVLAWPGISLSILVLLVAIWAIISGVFEIIAGIVAAWAQPGRILLSIVGVFSLILGIVIFAYPLISTTVFIWLLGIYALFIGLAMIIFSIQLKASK